MLDRSLRDHGIRRKPSPFAAIRDDDRFGAALHQRLFDQHLTRIDIADATSLRDAHRAEKAQVQVDIGQQLGASDQGDRVPSQCAAWHQNMDVRAIQKALRNVQAVRYDRQIGQRFEVRHERRRRRAGIERDAESIFDEFCRRCTDPFFLVAVLPLPNME